MRHATPWIVVDNWFNKVGMSVQSTALTELSVWLKSEKAVMYAWNVHVVRS